MANLSRLPSPTQASWEWQYDGLCVGLDADHFFTTPGERGLSKLRREERAVRICRRCPVIEQCREHALRVREPYGVWGGLTEEDRDRILGPLPRTEEAGA